MNFLYLSLDDVLLIHAEGIKVYGGREGVRDLGLIESALAQQDAGYGGIERFPTLCEKAVALSYFLIRNHGFIDGNKRVGFACMDSFLRLNGFRVAAELNEAEAATLAVAASQWNLAQLTEWVRAHLQSLPT